MVQVHKVYGSVAVLPIVLTWIYISWYIALVGCRLCYALDASRMPEPHPDIQAAAARETFVARLMIVLVQLSREGPLTLRPLCSELHATRRMVREGLRALAEAGLAVETKQGRWLPGRDPSTITLAQLRTAARSTLRFPAQETEPLTEAVARAFAQAEGAAESVLGESLDSFLQRLDNGSVLEATPPPLAPVRSG
jgi:membrane protein